MNRRQSDTTSFILVALCCLSIESSATEDAVRRALADLEPRIRAIYEEGVFRPKTSQVAWAEDGSAYFVRETHPSRGERAWARYDLEDGSRTWAEPERSQSSDESPDRSKTLVYRDGNLLVRDQGGDAAVALTVDGDGTSVWNRDAHWSPDGQRVLFVQSDASEVPMRAMLVPGDPSYPEVREERFARVGGPIPQLRVGVVHGQGGDVAWLPIIDPGEDCYLGAVEWAGNSDEVLVEKLSRFRDQRWIYLIDLPTMEVSTIFHETDPAWVVASYEKNAGLQWIDGGAAFLVVSERDGWRHAYRVTRDGRESTLITPGAFDIIDKGPVDEAGGWFYFYASPTNGTQRYLYRAPLDGSGNLERVTPEDQPGWHSYEFSPDLRWAKHTYSNYNKPPVLDLVALTDHRSVRVLEDNSELRQKLASFPEISGEFLELDIDGGITMDAWLLKPKGFDPSKKWPVYIYVYGEPHGQTVLDRWGAAMADYHRAIAELGYLVVSIDNRGTPAPKGAAWRRSIFGSLGPLSTEEQTQGIQRLAELRSYVDLDRVGIWGWSGGGSNTLNAMFRRPDVYKLGIAVVPKPQPHLYNAWFQEIYMNDRETNPEGYESAAPIHYAEGLEGDLLIIHGSGETNTHLQIVEGLADRLIALGKPFDFMVYPNRNHGIREGEGTTVHMRMHMARYLLTHLEPGPR